MGLDMYMRKRIDGDKLPLEDEYGRTIDDASWDCPVKKPMPEKLDDAIEAAIEYKGWSFDYTTRGSVELEKDSPLGEDFVVEVDVRGFEKKLREYCKGFDPDEHAAMLVRHRGECGVPDSVLEIAQDAFAIQEMLDELCEAVELVSKLAAKDK